MSENTMLYRNWDNFQTSDKVGVITTLFSEQYLSSSYEIVTLSQNTFIQEIEENNLDTVFIDNDLFETDHCWYRVNRGHIINYLRRTKKHICVIKNSTKKIARIFKDCFVLEINPHAKKYRYDGLILQAPILLNTEKYNPITASKSTELIYFDLGINTKSLERKIIKTDLNYIIKTISGGTLTRKLLVKLFIGLKETSILYINNTVKLDEITLRYIEYIAYLNSVYVIFDKAHEFNSLFNHDMNNEGTNNILSVLLKNREFTFKKVLKRQRNILINNSLIMQYNLKSLLDSDTISPLLPSISIVTATNRPDSVGYYLKQVNQQKYVNLEINIVTHGFKLSTQKINEIKDKSKFPINIIEAEESETLGACLNKAVNVSSYSVIAKIDDDDYYLDHYLIDQWLALKYSRAEVVGKLETYYYFESEDIIAVRKKGEHLKYGEFIMGATIMMNSKLLKKLLFADLPRAIDTDLLNRVKENSGLIYISHPYEMCVFRSKHIDNHTWQVNDYVMLKDAEIIGYGNPTSYVSIN